MYYSPKLVQLFYTLLFASQRRIRYDALWTINNLICTSEPIAIDFFVVDVVNKLIDISYFDSEKLNRSESLGVLHAFMSYRTSDIIEKLVAGYKLIDICMENLKDEDETIVDRSLDIIAEILDYGEALADSQNQVVEYIVEKFDVEVFVDLQHKDSQTIYDKVSSIIQEYFLEYFES